MQTKWLWEHVSVHLNNTYECATLLPSMIIIRFSNNSGFSLNSLSFNSRLMTDFRVDCVAVVEFPALIGVVDNDDDKLPNDVDGFCKSNRFPSTGTLFGRLFFLGILNFPFRC